MATGSVIYFPKQSKPKPPKKKPGQKCTVLQWIRNCYQFPNGPDAQLMDETYEEYRERVNGVAPAPEGGSK